jgi:uncharacterized protein
MTPKQAHPKRATKTLLTPDASKAPQASAAVHLLDGNVLVALVSAAHVHHAAALHWFSTTTCPFATCPITQGTLLRLTLHLGDITPHIAVQMLTQLTAHPRHRFWPDDLAYADISWRGVLGHRQVTDAYLAALARHHKGRLATFDTGLVALHPDVAMSLESAPAAR